MSGTGQTESRLGLADVPGEISRIFFGTGPGGGPGYRGGYGAEPTGYGAEPTGYAASSVGQGQYSGVRQGRGWYTGGEKSVD